MRCKDQHENIGEASEYEDLLTLKAYSNQKGIPELHCAVPVASMIAIAEAPTINFPLPSPPQGRPQEDRVDCSFRQPALPASVPRKSFSFAAQVFCIGFFDTDSMQERS